MPSVDVAMARSIRGGLWETMRDNLIRGIAADVTRRDAVGSAQHGVSDVKDAFSSWDGCMRHSFCKWPAIAIIVVGGLIILSIVVCIVRCCCCGVSCCCSCCYCLKCCGECCGCCDAPGGKRRKYLDEPYNPPQQQGYGYRQQAPMEAQFPAHTGPGYKSAGPPQYAEFDVAKKGDADSLPAMPSWEGSNSRKVELEEAVEMDNLQKKDPAPEQRVSPMPSSTYGTHPNQRVMTRNGPYNPNAPVQNNSTSHLNAYGQQPQKPYGSQTHGYDNNRLSDGFDLDQPYDTPAAPPAALGMGPGRHHSPGPIGAGGYGALRQMSPAPAQMPTAPLELDGDFPSPGVSPGVSPYGMDPRMRSSPGPGQNPRRAPGPRNEFGAPPGRFNSPGPMNGPGRMNSPGPMNGPGRMNSPGPLNSPGRMNTPGPRGSPAPGPNPRRTPGPQNEFGAPPPRLNSPKPASYRSYSPAPLSPQSASITNNSGFDFNSGFSRPQTREGENFDRRPSESHERDEHEAYPGYKPYTPAQQAWSGV